jgi:5-methylcytosine-specific restriction endonuclease McrA
MPGDGASQPWKNRGDLLFAFFEGHPCVDCGESDAIVLEFDHVNDKSFDIGRGFRNKNWQEVLDEMSRCEVVCVNCHRRRTARRSGSARFRSLNATLRSEHMSTVGR